MRRGNIPCRIKNATTIKRNTLKSKAAKACGRTHCDKCPYFKICISPFGQTSFDICTHAFIHGFEKGYKLAKKEMREKAKHKIQ